MPEPLGIKITGNVRTVGSNENNGKVKHFVQLEIPSGFGNVELVKVGTKNNGQKHGEVLTLTVSPNVFNGTFYGFRQI